MSSSIAPRTSSKVQAMPASAIRKLVPFSEAAEAKIERLKVSSEAAVARLLAPLDRTADEHHAKGDFKAAENVYLTADLGDLEPEARDVVKARIESIRAEAAAGETPDP